MAGRMKRGALEKLLHQAISSAANDPPLARATRRANGAGASVASLGASLVGGGPRAEAPEGRREGRVMSGGEVHTGAESDAGGGLVMWMSAR